MSSEVYSRLREQLDQYSVGFPATASGVEMRLLEKLFTEEEAEMYLLLSMRLEDPAAVAERTGQDPAAVRAFLEQMAEKGLIFRHRKGESLRYAAVPWVVGFYEFQLKTMDRELAQLFEDYFEEGFARQSVEVDAPMRPIPINRAVEVSYPVAPYEDAREILKSQKEIAVANCICRVQQGLLEQACDNPLEVCFMFGSHARYYVDRGMGRPVTAEEAIEILDKCEEAGLVTQPFNAQNPGGMCNCCGDCCGILRALRKQPRPAQHTVSNYYAASDPDVCIACETCLERCQMEAVTISEEDVAVVDLDRCIGCGLCVTTCPTEAMSLKPKPEDQRRQPPVKGRDAMMEMAQRRGKSLVPLALVK